MSLGVCPRTLRLDFPVDLGVEITRGFVAEKILRDELGLTGTEVLCLQAARPPWMYEVTFRELSFLRATAMRWLEIRKRDPDSVLGKCAFEVGAEEFTVVIHVFNPHVLEKDIRSFLERYCSRISEGVKIVDEFGFWTGKRRYRVMFRLRPTGEWRIPPHEFALGADRGRLFVPQLPNTCWTCGQRGHLRGECKAKPCYRCGTVGHLANVCKAAKTCNLCGKGDHLFVSCPKRSSYAGVVAGGSIAVSGGGGGQVAGGTVLQVVAPAPKVVPVAVSPVLEGPGGTEGTLMDVPHGRQDGRLGDKGTGKHMAAVQTVGGVAAEVERKTVGDWAEHTESQEVEMAGMAEMAGKRPLEDGGPDDTPVRRPRTGALVPGPSLPPEAGPGTASGQVVVESDGSDSSVDSVREVLPAGGVVPPPTPPVRLAGWDVESLKRTMGME